jgi:hypothetical protein
MARLCAFCLMALLTLGSAAALGAPPVPQPGPPTAVGKPAMVPPPHGDYVKAVIHAIDYRRGLVTVATEAAVMQLRLAPEAVRGLRVGGTVLVLAGCQRC